MQRLSQVGLGLLLAGALAAAGCGGGGGSTPGPVPTVTAPPATVTPSPNTGGFVPAQSAITDLPAGAGAFGSTVLPGSAAAYLIAQSATTPVEPGTSGTSSIPLANWNVTVSESAGLSTQGLRTVRRSGPSGEEADTHWDVPQSRFAPIYRQIAQFEKAPFHGPQVQSRKQQAFAVGQTRQFFVLTGNITGTGGTSGNCPPSPATIPCQTISATLLAQSAHANVWLDNTVYGNAAEYAKEFPSGTSAFTTTANNFEQYFQIETSTFGPAYLASNPNFKQCTPSGGTPASYETPPDLSGTVDPHINIVITNLLTSLGEGGYFFSGDLIAQQSLNCGGSSIAPSNELPMFYIGSDYYPQQTGSTAPIYNPTFWLNSDMPRSISHEFQHYLHNLNKYLKPTSLGQLGVFDDVWIDEGCSMLAEDIAANGIAIDTPRYSFSYLSNPDEYSLTSFTAYNPDPLSTSQNPPYAYFHNTAGNYGASYLFLRYVYDRFGPGALQTLYGSLTSGVGPIVAAAGGESFTPLYREWAIAVASQNSGTNTNGDRRYQFSNAIVLNGPVTVTSRVKASGSRVLYFGGPQPPVDISQSPVNGNLPMPALNVGSTLSLKMIDGATMFFHPAPASGGATVRVSGTSPNLQGAVVQGVFPTPMPTAP